MLLRRSEMLMCLASMLLAARPALSQLHCTPGEDKMGAPGVEVTLNASYTGSLPPPPYGYVDNYVIYVNGTAHSGQSYTFTPTLNPSEYVYYATATKHVLGQATDVSSLDTAGDGRAGDLIAIQGCGVDTVLYTGDYPLYTRGTGSGQDVPRPQWTQTSSWPACYGVGSAVILNFHTTGSGSNNGVNLQYTATGDLTKQDGASEGAAGWPFAVGSTSYTAGAITILTTPNLPAYVYKHYLQLSFNWSVVFSVDSARATFAYQQVVTPIEAVFTDPNATFPPYHVADDPNNPLQTKPWYEIIDNALDHVTGGGNNMTVTDPVTAMANLTTDLYVWPNEPWGPGSSWYNPSAPPNYYGYNLGSSPGELRYNLWGMAMNSSGDCQDFAAYLECEADSLGITGVGKVRLGAPNGGGFVVTPAIACGEYAPHDPSFSFNFHQMTWWVGGGGVYDWAVAHPNVWWPTVPPWYLSVGFSQAQQYSEVVAAPWDEYNPPAWSSVFGLGANDPLYNNLPTLLGSYLP